MTPGRGGQTHLGLPVFNTVQDAVRETGATASMIYVPAAGAADSILEAADAGIELIVCITEGVPVNDMVRVKAVLAGSVDAAWSAPTAPGSSRRMNARSASCPASSTRRVRSASCRVPARLPMRPCFRPRRIGLGQSTCVGIGGDPVRGMSFIDVLELFERDPRTEGIILVGEIGGSDEEAAARYIRKFVSKPVVAYVAGVTAPAGQAHGTRGRDRRGRQGHWPPKSTRRSKPPGFAR